MNEVPRLNEEQKLSEGEKMRAESLNNYLKNKINDEINGQAYMDAVNETRFNEGKAAKLIIKKTSGEVIEIDIDPKEIFRTDFSDEAITDYGDRNFAELQMRLGQLEPNIKLVPKEMVN